LFERRKGKCFVELARLGARAIIEIKIVVIWHVKGREPPGDSPGPVACGSGVRNQNKCYLVYVV
jgi:hypothetical protein